MVFANSHLLFPTFDSSTQLIEWETFNQILELDEDGTHDFSQQMVEDFYTQAEETFEEMNELLWVRFGHLRG
jgi:osomolarity two-component system phosphorelay intermediate protein YPD1